MPIVWLASFPKSGNTWARALLANYFAGGKPVGINELHAFAVSDTQLWPYERAAGRPLPEATLQDIMPYKAAAHRLLAGAGKGAVFAKTHTALKRIHGVPAITPAVTAGAIYVARNPLDVVLSYADHFGLAPADAVGALASPILATLGRADRAPEFLGPWSEHVRGWTRAKGLPHVVLRYEDLQADAARELVRALEFLRQPVDAARAAEAARHASFDALARQEALGGFRERSRNQARFFRSGKAGQWREALAPDLVARVVRDHGEVMAELGYLDARGDPI